MKKFLATTLCAATLFGATFTSADAASLNKAVKIESNPQIIQMIQGDNYQASALKLIEKMSVQNREFDLNKFEDLVKNTLNNSEAFKVIQAGKVVINKEKTTTNKVEKEVKPPQTTATPLTNNTKAPTTTNNQQVQTPAKQTPATNVNQSVSEFEKQVVDLTNAERTKAGLKPLEIHTPLMGVAQTKSEDMAKNNYFDHNSPTYGSPFDQIKAAGITYRAAGENIAQGQQTPAQVVQAWMDSPGHRQNILNANYTHIGVGYVAAGHYWTQQFIQL